MAPRGVPWPWGVPWPSRGVPWPLYEEYVLEDPYNISTNMLSNASTPKKLMAIKKN